MGSLAKILFSTTARRISTSSIYISPIPRFSSISSSLFSTKQRSGIWKAWIYHLKPAGIYSRLLTDRNTQFVVRYFRGFVDASGTSVCRRTLIDLTTLAGSMAIWASDVYAMDGMETLVEHHRESEEPSVYLNDDLYNFWALAKRFQLPAVLLLMVILGWRHPVTLVINIFLLLSCTRPSPYSVYIFIEQLRKQAMQHDPGLSKSKLFYARKVDVQDYKLLCTAKVELRDRKLSLIGILGNWWIFQCS